MFRLVITWILKCLFDFLNLQKIYIYIIIYNNIWPPVLHLYTFTILHGCVFVAKPQLLASSNQAVMGSAWRPARLPQDPQQHFPRNGSVAASESGAETNDPLSSPNHRTQSVHPRWKNPWPVRSHLQDGSLQDHNELAKGLQNHSREKDLRGNTICIYWDWSFGSMEALLLHGCHQHLRQGTNWILYENILQDAILDLQALLHWNWGLHTVHHTWQKWSKSQQIQPRKDV